MTRRLESLAKCEPLTRREDIYTMYVGAQQQLMDELEPFSYPEKLILRMIKS